MQNRLLFLPALLALCAPAAAQDVIFHLEPPQVSEYGASLHPLGDRDGDGHDDFSSGLWQGTTFVYHVVSGRDGLTMESYEAGLGIPLLLVDLDGDGVLEFVSGASFYTAGDIIVKDGPTKQVLYVVKLPAGSTSFGQSATTVGDLNQDGVLDLALSASQDAVVVDGKLTHKVGRIFFHSGADGAPLGVLEPDELVTSFGVVTPLGDVTGDGVADVAVGAEGRAWIASPMHGALVMPLGGVDVEGRFGTRIANVGDLDGDGRNDVLVGAPQSGDAETRPYVEVFSGATGALLHHIDALPGDFFGSAVEGAGDLDGDDTPDFLVSAPQRLGSFPATGPGYVTAFSGKDASVLFTVAGEVDGSAYGTLMKPLGDVNGDGCSDFMASRSGLASGSVGHVRSGKPLALEADRHVVSAALGATQSLQLDFGAHHAGAPYLVLGTASGRDPGFTIAGVHVALNPDAWLVFTMVHPGSLVLPGSAGELDGSGTASAAVVVPPVANPALHGLTLDHAAVLLDGDVPLAASHPVPLTIVP